MRRLPIIDGLLLAVLIPIWLIALALHVRQVMTDRLAHVGIYVGAVTDSEHPVVTGIWPGLEPHASPIRVGDRVQALGDTDLAGYGAPSFFALAISQRSRRLDDGELPPGGLLTVTGSDGTITATLPFAPAAFPWRTLPLTIGLVTTATLLLLRRPREAVIRSFFLAATTFAIHWTWFFGGNEALTYSWIVVYGIVSSLMFPFILTTAAMFASGPDKPSGWPVWPWIFALNGPIALTASIGAPLPPAYGLPGVYVMNLAMIATLLLVLTRNYRRAGPVGQRQLKWVVYGLYAGLAPVLAADIVVLGYPSLWWLHDVAVSAEVLIPACIFIAIVRYNLYDIDRLITATVVYSVLIAGMLGIILLVVPPLAETTSAALSIPADVGRPVFSLIAALALVATHRLLAPSVESFLFRERMRVQEGINDLLAALRDTPSPEALLDLVTDRLTAIYHPETCRIESAPPLDAAPVHDAAASTVTVPLGSAGMGRPHLVLGPKASGDAYSPADVALVSAVADAVSSELARQDDRRRTAAAPVLLPPRYAVLAELGRGGMGTVYHVEHTELHTSFAMKVLHRHFAGDHEMTARFHREARLMARLEHPNIVRVIDVNAEHDLHYIVMEYVAGFSLAAVLQKNGPMPFARLLEIATQVGSALAEAHAHRPPIVHRDIKPGNVLIEDATGRAVVTDFGIAKVMGLEKTLHTRTGTALGTLHYCSPEQFRGEDDIDGRADVYALGLVMYEMAAGRAYFEGSTEHDLAAHLLDPTDATNLVVLDTHDQLTPIIERAIRPQRQARYPTILDLLSDLARLRETIP